MSNEVPHRPEHLDMARALVAETKAAGGGLAPVDLGRFWEDQDVGARDPFGADIPQVPLGAILNWECVFEELGVETDHWRYEHDDEWRLSLNEAYNDHAEKVVGRRLLSEKARDPSRAWPAHKGLHDCFEAKNVWQANSWWLEQSATNEDELKALLDRVEERDVRSFILPENWAEEKERLTKLGVRPPRYRGQRGPTTFATSIYGPENLVFLMIDNPDLAARLRDNILRVMLEIARVLDVEAGDDESTSPRGFYFCDDNCVLLNKEMYDFFSLPILKGVFERFSPDPGDMRGQHSDSDMAHHLPSLRSLGMTSVNFGPTVEASEIRRHCPRAVINGQMAPFTYSRNEEEGIVLEFLRDFEMTRESRGLVFATAGSINGGTRLTSMRLAMAAIQRHGRYDGG
ncbi:MAG: uroporphyrinogen decarboxylase family protein [Planctomycetota bacterium]|jgi:uroporphyrinogen decarboxylase